MVDNLCRIKPSIKAITETIEMITSKIPCEKQSPIPGPEVHPREYVSENICTITKNTPKDIGAIGMVINI